MGQLTTHVLDIARGRPAAGMIVELYRIELGEQRLAVGTTNADGRVDPALLDGDAMTAGVYELRFHAGAYLRGLGPQPEPPFLDVIPIRFAVAAPGERYHVPLLLSPYGYATYRGS